MRRRRGREGGRRERKGRTGGEGEEKRGSEKGGGGGGEWEGIASKYSLQGNVKGQQGSGYG